MVVVVVRVQMPHKHPEVAEQVAAEMALLVQL
jgi:hypothetical protein